MFKAKTHMTLTSLALGMACLAVPCVSTAATPVKLSGAIDGVVRNAGGVPQLGAAVVLYNRQDRTLDRVLTDSAGNFQFLGLSPDLYSVRVTMAAFLAFKKDILVQPGMRSVLAVNLNSLFSTIQLAYPPIENGSLITDDWKWALRTGAAARPVQRFLPELAPRPVSTARIAAFSDTRAILRLSAGEGAVVTGVANEADLGTAYALATSLFGSHTLQVSGNLGYGSQTGVPTAAFRTSYSRNLMGGSPEVSVTMRQLFLPGRLAAALSGSENSFPLLRTMSAAFDDHTQINEDITLRYGFALDSVAFLDHLNYFSPYARLVWSMGDGATLDVTYTSGNARPDLAGSPSSEEADLQRGLNSLALFPRMSVRAGKPKVQRGEEYEVTYSRTAGSRTFSASAYHESVSNTAITLSAPAGLYSNADLLPDVFSDSSTFNAGDFTSTGYTVALTQNLSEHVSATVLYGSVGVLTANRHELLSDNPDELRTMIRAGRRQAATARVTATIPSSGTHVVASYQWTSEGRWALPGNLYSTQAFHPMPGFNVLIRQPIPGFSKRVEATADVRNMLAQGYLPLGMVNGRRVMLAPTPRSLRGGLAFIF